MNDFDAFNEAKARAENRRQNAMAEAHKTFGDAVAWGKIGHQLIRKRAQDAFDEVKSDPAHPEHVMRREAFDQARKPANHRRAHDALAEAVAAADAEFHREVAALAVEHGVTIYPGPTN